MHMPLQPHNTHTHTHRHTHKQTPGYFSPRFCLIRSSYSRCSFPPDIRFSKKPGLSYVVLVLVLPLSKYVPRVLRSKLLASSSNWSAAPPSDSGFSKLVFFRSPSMGAPAPIDITCIRPEKSMPFFLGSSSSGLALATTTGVSR